MSSNRGLRPLDPIFDPDKRLGAISPGNTPGGPVPELVRRDLFGVINSVRETPPWVVNTAASYTQCVIGYLVGDSVEFDIKVNGTIVETITLGGGSSPEEFDVNVVVEHNDGAIFDIARRQFGQMGAQSFAGEALQVGVNGHAQSSSLALAAGSVDSGQFHPRCSGHQVTTSYSQSGTCSVVPSPCRHG